MVIGMTAPPGMSPPPPILEDPDAAPARRPPPLQRHLVIQADQFCACGYNLHGQTVERDERLDLPLVRCPECGRWHPAGHGSTALRPWLARLATLGLALWMLLMAAYAVASGGVLIGMQFFFLEMNTAYALLDVGSGREVEYDSALAASAAPAANLTTNPATLPTTAPAAASAATVGAAPPVLYRYLDTGDPVPAGAQVEWASVPLYHPAAARSTFRPPAFARYLPILIAAAVGLLGGILQAAALWHVRDWRRALPPLAVLLFAGGMYAMIVSGESSYSYVKSMAYGFGGLVLGAATAGWVVGTLVGRRVARFLVSLLVPPRPRQVFAFLWLADGRPAPSPADGPR